MSIPDTTAGTLEAPSRPGLDDIGVWIAGVALGLALATISYFGQTWGAAAAAVVVVAVGACYVRTLGAETGVLVLLMVTATIDHFTFRVGSLNLRAEQVAMALALVIAAASVQRREDWTLLRPNTSEWLLLAWLGWSAVASVVFSPDRHLSAKVLALTGICALAFAVPRRLMSGPQGAARFDVAVRWLLIIFATESAYGTMAYLLHVFGPTISIGPNPASGHLEAYGTLWEQNVFGAFAAAGAVAWVYLGRSRLRLSWVGLALGVGGLVDSLTRAAWLAAAFVGAIGVGLPGLRRRLNMKLVVTGLVGGLVLSAAVVAVDAIGSYTVPVPGATTQPHRSLLAAIFNMTDFIGRLNQTSPVWSDIHGIDVLFGRGTASFESLHVFEGIPEHIASLPLLVLNDTGIVGLILFAGFAAAVVKQAWRWRRHELVAGLGQMALVIGLANLATQTTELMVDWLLIGILMVGVDVAARGASAASEGESRGAQQARAAKC